MSRNKLQPIHWTTPEERKFFETLKTIDFREVMKCLYCEQTGKELRYAKDDLGADVQICTECIRRFQKIEESKLKK